MPFDPLRRSPVDVVQYFSGLSVIAARTGRCREPGRPRRKAQRDQYRTQNARTDPRRTPFARHLGRSRGLRGTGSSIDGVWKAICRGDSTSTASRSVPACGDAPPIATGRFQRRRVGRYASATRCCDHLRQHCRILKAPCSCPLRRPFAISTLAIRRHSLAALPRRRLAPFPGTSSSETMRDHRRRA